MSWQSASSRAGQYRHQPGTAGTAPSLLVVSPAGVLMPIVGRTSIWLFNSAASSIMAFAILLTAFRLDVQWLGVAVSLPFIILSAAGYYCMSLCLGSII